MHQAHILSTVPHLKNNQSSDNNMLKLAPQIHNCHTLAQKQNLFYMHPTPMVPHHSTSFEEIGPGISDKSLWMGTWTEALTVIIHFKIPLQ